MPSDLVPRRIVFINDQAQRVKLLKKHLAEAERGVWRQLTLTQYNGDGTMDIHHINLGGPIRDDKPLQ